MTTKPLSRNRAQQGFTMIELIMVIAVIGIISTIILAKQFGAGAGNPGRAQSMYQVGDRLANQWASLVQVTGVPATVASNPLPKSNNTVMDVLINGSDFIAAAYVDAYNNYGFRPLSNSLVTTTAPVAATSAGAYATQDGYTVTISTPDSYTFQTVFSSVPSAIVKVLWDKYMTGTFDPATANTTGIVQYTAAANGTHTLTLEYKM